ncbi:hypothetical protein HCN44_001717 [Aphidius gifuensis]|uniref:Fibronectin type-III domain-containing protein n=1 Tax=Aphidius gifuensis TaxID=684658 RepID=A0A834XVI5_APHGI|nr:uncharacterized protein LOC122853094 [Aphidius gifuensis]KAF7992392.1 hypothetical protein HCN44_001717 [Aphidius gifuensis]
MNYLCLLFVMCCAGLVNYTMAFDLGPLVRIAQCRVQCIENHSTDGTCDWYANRAETLCSECWQNCDTLETQWESSKSMCDEENYFHCPACKIPCHYRLSRIEEEVMPSSLPAPMRGPVKLNNQDIAIVLRKVGSTWKEEGFYPSTKIPSLRQDTWILVVEDEGLKHYSWEEWTPKLESLKDGAFVEATLSWTDVDVQLKKQREIEQKKFNDRIRQFYLEKYGEKVLSERNDNKNTPITEEVVRRFFFKRDNYDNDDNDNTKPTKTDSVRTDNDDVFGEKKYTDKDESYVVSWEPETGGLMGNQVVDTTSAQISLLPGTKYLVRIASNDGPGSYPIEIDTRPRPVLRWQYQPNFQDNINEWAIVAGFLSALLVLILITIIRTVTKRKTVDDVNEV